MHFLETIYQRHWLDKEFPNGVTKYLDDIGFLSSRLSLAHCIYLREEEMEILAERGVTIVINSSSNLIVSSGLASVAKMLERGCKVAMGLDGLAFDEDEDSVREMRLTYNLHKALGFNRYITKDQIQTIAMQNGYRVITKKRAGGSLKVGQPADFLSLNWNTNVCYRSNWKFFSYNSRTINHLGWACFFTLNFFCAYGYLYSFRNFYDCYHSFYS